MIDFRELKRKLVYKTTRWKKLRADVLKRDKFTCQSCGELLTSYQHIDHIIELDVNNLEDEAIVFGIDNLQTLCPKCHNKKTKRKIYKTCVFDGRNVDYNERGRL